MLAAGSAAGVGYWLSIYPIDMIKTVVQTDHSDPAQRKYKGMWDAARSVRLNHIQCKRSVSWLVWCACVSVDFVGV